MLGQFNCKPVGIDFFLREKRNKTFELKRPSDHKWFFQLLFLLFIYLFIMKWMENQKNQNNWLFLLFIEHLRLYSRIIIQKVCVCSLREFFSFYFSGLNSDDLEQSTVPQRSNTYDIDMQVHIWHTHASTHMIYICKYTYDIHVQVQYKTRADLFLLESSCPGRESPFPYLITHTHAFPSRKWVSCVYPSKLLHAQLWSRFHSTFPNL